MKEKRTDPVALGEVLAATDDVEAICPVFTVDDDFGGGGGGGRGYRCP